jgi:hypothetical protein
MYRHSCCCRHSCFAGIPADVQAFLLFKSFLMMQAFLLLQAFPRLQVFLLSQAFLLLQAPFSGVVLPVVGSRPFLASLF